MDNLGTAGAYPVSSLPVDQLGLYRTRLELDRGAMTLVASASASASASVVRPGVYRVAGTLTGPDGQSLDVESVDVELPAGTSDVAVSFNATGLAAGTYTVSDLAIVNAEELDEEALARPASYDLAEPGEPGEPGEDANPTVRTARSLTLTNQFRTTGARGDVVTEQDFACDSEVHISGSVIAAGDVRMTNECRIEGDVHAGGAVVMDSRASVGGDIIAVGDVRLQSTVTITGAITSGGSVRSIDSRSLADLQDAKVVGGEIVEAATVDAPTLPAASIIPSPEDPAWSSFGQLTWRQWMNQTATANAAPAWSPGLSSSPGCVMAPWAASVNSAEVVVTDATLIDTRHGASGCADGVTLQGMTLALGADLVIYTDQLSVINGLRVMSLDGQSHVLRVLSPAGSAQCTGAPSVDVRNGLVADPEIDVQIAAAARVSLNGPVALNMRVDAGCLAASGSVALVRTTPGVP
ncbi:polymer-forming cytoskeletal protein [Cellulomonas chengniuliangii]|nr:polymer-forming cytoskeletal protein [Cellulomonas chengniuliangii]MCC2308542.1 polymer-forming cytoskeletal protein [Cellulomonas chengniuliangii]